MSSNLIGYGIGLAFLGVMLLYYWLRLRSEAATIDVREELLIARLTSGRIVRLAWADLREVSLLTSDAGPLDTDVHWELRDLHGRTLRIRQDIRDGSDLLKKLQTLPGFDNGALSEAMGTARNRRFRCWRDPR